MIARNQSYKVAVAIAAGAEMHMGEADKVLQEGDAKMHLGEAMKALQAGDTAGAKMHAQVAQDSL